MLCKPLNPMVLLIIIPFLNGYSIGNINPTFSDIPTSMWVVTKSNMLQSDHVKWIIPEIGRWIWWKDAGSYGSATKKNTIIFQAPCLAFMILKCVSVFESPSSQKTRKKQTKKHLRDEFLGIFMQSMSENQLMFANAADVRHAHPPEGMKCGLPQSRHDSPSFPHKLRRILVLGAISKLRHRLS